MINASNQQGAHVCAGCQFVFRTTHTHKTDPSHHVCSWEQQFEKYFAANSVEKGGSFYVQSKIYRAKEMLDQYIQEKKMEDKAARDQQTQSEPKD